MLRNRMRKSFLPGAMLATVFLIAGCSEPWITGKAVDSRPVAVSGTGTVVVQKGDTVYGIARSHDLEIRALIEANALHPPYALQVGQKLRLPGQRSYTVQKGDTIYGISRQFGVDMRELVQRNGIGQPYTIAVGQKLTLPDGVRPVQTALAREKTTSGTSQAVATKHVPQPPPRGQRNFLMPVEGKLIAGFGPKPGGLHNDGINIAAPAGTPVRAAENGVVVYAGNELRGFGNLLLIKHADSWMTAYGHADALLVKRGDVVKRGEKVATVGKSGNVDVTQLHFELRQGARAVDPSRYLAVRSLREAPKQDLAERLAETPG